MKITNSALENEYNEIKAMLETQRCLKEKSEEHKIYRKKIAEYVNLETITAERLTNIDIVNDNIEKIYEAVEAVEANIQKLRRPFKNTIRYGHSSVSDCIFNKFHVSLVFSALSWNCAHRDYNLDHLLLHILLNQDIYMIELLAFWGVIHHKYDGPSSIMIGNTQLVIPEIDTTQKWDNIKDNFWEVISLLYEFRDKIELEPKDVESAAAAHEILNIMLALVDNRRRSTKTN